MYSSSLRKSTATGSSVCHWRPSAAYAVYPDDYPHSTLDDLSPGDCIPDDYLQNDKHGRTNSGSFLNDCTAVDAKARTPAVESSLCTNVQVLAAVDMKYMLRSYYLTVTTGCGVVFMPCLRAGVLTLSVQVATAVLFVFCCFCCCCCCMPLAPRACDRSLYVVVASDAVHFLLKSVALLPALQLFLVLLMLLLLSTPLLHVQQHRCSCLPLLDSVLPLLLLLQSLQGS